LPKPVRSAILAAKPSESGECRLIRKEIFCNLEHLIRIGVCPAVIGLIGAQKHYGQCPAAVDIAVGAV
jgi:hypothetical protein